MSSTTTAPSPAPVPLLFWLVCGAGLGFLFGHFESDYGVYREWALGVTPEFLQLPEEEQ